MGTRELSFLKAQVNLFGRGLLNPFLRGNMSGVVASFWVLLSNFLLFVFGSVGGYISRFQAAEKSEKNEESSCFAGSQEDDGMDSESGEIENREHNENVIGSDGDEEGSVLVETASSMYQFCTGRDISGFVEQPEIMSFAVQEVHVDSSDDYTILSKDIDAGNCGSKEFGEEETEVQEQIEDSLEKYGSVQSNAMDEVLGDKVREQLMDHQLTGKAEVLESEDDFLDDDAFLDEEEMILDDISSQADQVDPELESVCSDDGIAFGADSANTFDDRGQQHLENSEVDAAVDLNGDGRIPSSEEDEMLSETTLDAEAAFVADQPSDSETESDEDYIEVKLQKTNFSNMNGLSCKNSVEDNHKGEDPAYDDMEPTTANSENSPELGHFPGNLSASDSDDNWDWGHDDIVEQLKMELKNVRTGGLPTILEESETESPTMVGDDDLKLKPLKIDQKLEPKDLLQEIQKVYKSYAEKIRKLDILNYQTLHAIGLLQLKDPLNSNTNRKALFLQNWTNRLRRPKVDSMAESMVALHGDLEMVYVGHACLSWGILQWQYGKARELREFDHGGFRRYNQVAGEFQLLRVLLQRFIEDEPFQGPRIEYYVKNRCVLRGLLQVPAIREDSSRDNKGKAAEEDAVSIETLVEIIEESMRVFWDFIRADRYEPDGGLKQSQLDQQDSADSVLMTALRTLLQKKERRLKDIVRSGNCIVKRFQKPRDRLDPSILFAQVELRLVSRVLSMRRVARDQLAWCGDKLDRIDIISRKIYVEPSFLLFPC
ncbi:uncharacterized protein LOC115755372 [Rhodamnia argentea]|uniref:Uncharacterized protein LOC115755372 n=1 Tax=Rhodamnia argentea TaxID=178133 RepID=A0A8B8QW98_9MYRT|nr:uncharacterized protein LOC115755372 [Rhodamnia argentea]